MIVKPRVATRRELVASSLAGLGLIHTAGAWAASPGGKLPLAHASAVAPSGRPVPMPDIPFPEDTAPVIDPGGPGLGQIAASHGRVFGAAAQSQLLATDPGYASIFARECGLLTPDYETKWAVLQPAENHFNFAPLDSLLAWARAYSKPVRGTALVWHEGLPDWVAAAMAESPARARALLNNQIGRVLAHTQGSIRDWDVVNEVVADPAGSDTPQSGPGELRDSPFLRALGPDYIALSLQMAKEINPAIRVSLNEYGTEEAAPHHIEKRRRLLNLVRRLRRANVPLDQVGLQGHLQLVQPFSGPPFTAFCRLLRAEGVELVVTEMDIREHWKLPDGLAARDRAVADRVKAFVDAAIDGGIKTFITWGMQDKYSWLATNKYVKRTDGQEHRGLPLDDAGHRKLYWQAMADALGRP